MTIETRLRNTSTISSGSGSASGTVTAFGSTPIVLVHTDGTTTGFNDALLAQNAAIFGETIIVYAGSYSLGTGWLSKNGVDWYFDPNSLVTSTGARGVWFDSGTAMTFKVTGYGNFISSGSGNVATIYMKSVSSNTYWQFNTVYAKGPANSPAIRMNGNSTMFINEYSKSDNYDAFWGESGIGYLDANELSATVVTGDNAIELDSGTWYIKTKVARGSGKSGSPSIMLLDGAQAYMEIDQIGRGGIVDEEAIRTDNFAVPINVYIKTKLGFGFINYANAGGVSGDFLKIEEGTFNASKVTTFDAVLVQGSGLTLKDVNIISSTSRSVSISGAGNTFTLEGDLTVNRAIASTVSIAGGGMVYQSSSAVLYGYAATKGFSWDGTTIVANQFAAFNPTAASSFFAYNTGLTRNIQITQTETDAIMQANVADWQIKTTADGNIKPGNLTLWQDIVGSTTAPRSAWAYGLATAALNTGSFSIFQVTVQKNQTALSTCNGFFADMQANFGWAMHANLAATGSNSWGYVTGVHGVSCIGVLSKVDIASGINEAHYNYNFTGTGNMIEFRMEEDPLNRGTYAGAFSGNIINIMKRGITVSTVDHNGVFSGAAYQIKEGSNARMGTGILSGGTATISTNKVTTNTRIFISDQGGSVTNVGSLYVSARSAGASFTISSVNVLDASTFAWMLVEPA